MKEHATDESLSEQTRESAKETLDELARNDSFQGKSMAHTRKLAIASEIVGEDMAKYLQRHRLLHYADVMIRVAGMCVEYPQVSCALCAHTIHSDTLAVAGMPCQATCSI
jgi:hypothetical protein